MEHDLVKISIIINTLSVEFVAYHSKLIAFVCFDYVFLLNMHRNSGKCFEAIFVIKNI